MSDFDIKKTRCDIEIFDRKTNPDFPVVSANGVRINGTEVLLPDDAEIRISDLGPKNMVKVTLTMFASSVKIGQSDR
jgi:hypothetical protein